MRDDEHAAARMRRRDPPQGAENAHRVGLVQLPVPRAVADLVRREPLARADVDLPQVGFRDDGQPEPPADDLGGLARAAQVARVDRGRRLGDEPLGQGLRLLASACIQKHVRMALPAVFGIPVGLAVANEEQCGHRKLG